MASSIFIVDSSPAVRRMVEDVSTPAGFEVIGFQDGPAALEAARRISPALIIADYHLDNMTFSGFCKEVHKLDHLNETYLISLIDPADRPDEAHLRTLGVKAFLKKPFQSDDLLDVIKSLDRSGPGPAKNNGFKRRVWPPASTGTDVDDEEEPVDRIDDSHEQEDGAMNVRIESSSATSAAGDSSSDAEEALRSLFGKLLQSLSDRTEKRLGDRVSVVVEQQMATRLQPLVQKELTAQLGEVLSQERLTALIQPLLMQELPGLIQKEVAACDPLIRQAVSGLVQTSIKDTLEPVVREQVKAGVREQLPDVVRDHLTAIDQVVKEEIRQATLKQAPLLADELVRAIAERAVDQAVLRLVPEMAEQQVQAELKRLSEGMEDTPRVSAF